MLIKFWRFNDYFLRKSFQLSVYASKHCQIFPRHVIWLPRRRLHWYWRIILNINISETLLTQQHAWRCSNVFMNYGLFKMYCDTNQVTRSNAKYCFIANWDINCSIQDVIQIKWMPSVSVKVLIAHNDVVGFCRVYEWSRMKQEFLSWNKTLPYAARDCGTWNIFIYFDNFIPSIEKPYVEVRSV